MQGYVTEGYPKTVNQMKTMLKNEKRGLLSLHYSLSVYT